jgi:hypothetical protein
VYVQRVMDCFFTWRETIVTICNDERLEQTETRFGRPFRASPLSDRIPGLKPWAILLDHFMVKGPMANARPIPSGQFHGQEQATGSGQLTTNLKPKTYNL